MKSIGLALFCFLCCIAEAKTQTLNGYYQEVQGPIAEQDAQYHFIGQNSFVYRDWDDVGDRFGAGTFEIKKDSIFFYFETVPTAFKGESVIAEKNNLETSVFQVVNPVFGEPHWKCSYQIIEADSVIDQQEVGHFGYFEVAVKENQLLRLYAHLQGLDNSFVYPFQIDFYGKKEQYNYCISSAAIRDYAQLIATTVKAYPFRLKKKGTLFGLKVNNEWIWYKKMNQNKL